MNWTMLPDGRKCLPEGTILRMESQGACYKITGAPVGYGGAGILYPAARIIKKGDQWQQESMWFALKECYPVGTDGMLDRSENGEICCVRQEDIYTKEYYDSACEMMRREKEITGKVFKKGFRLIPIWDVAVREEISFDGEHFCPAENYYSIMERLDEKGTSLGQILKNQPGGCLTAYQSICILEQILQAVDEVHTAGYLHGDIQENNIFLKGRAFEEGETGVVTLIDFGSAREFLEDGATAMITDRKLYSTSGYSAPECSSSNDGTLRLTRAADLYSIGYLMLRMFSGKAMDTRALQLVVNGKYIYPRQAKKIGCPSGSIDAVNKILQKALKEEPKERYQCADEMLEDIRRLGRALAPQKSVIASVDYDAFISYCHEEKSIQAAELIQKMIERYKIPKAVQKLSGKTKMRKVFRDREELSSSSDMEVHLKEALEHSEYLIVLLSPGVSESLWVKREIELFLQSHDRENILTVLVDGELQEVYPEILRKREKYADGQMQLLPVEGLAADIRGIDKKEQKQRLKTEIYRLLAPMLSCGYDDLRQRQREYRFKRTMHFMTAAVFAFGIIAAYMGWQAYQIQENYWDTLTRQSRYLAQVSADLLDSGDRIKAVQVAMEALPESGTDTSKPLVTEAEAALADALNVYQGVPGSARFMHADFQMEMDTKSMGIEAMSPEGNYLVSVDANKTLYIWDAKTGELLKKRNREFWNEYSAGNVFLGCEFLDEETVLLVTEKGILYIGVQEGQIEKRIEFQQKLTKEDMSYGWIREIIGEGSYLPDNYKDYFDRNSINYRCCCFSKDRTHLAVYDQFGPDGTFYVYRVKDGELVYTTGINEIVEETLDGNQMLEGVAVSADGRYAAAVFGTDWLADNLEKRGMVVILDQQEKKCVSIADEKHGCYQVCFLENGNLAVLGYDPAVHKSTLENRGDAVIKCYDPKEKNCIWETSFSCQFEADVEKGLVINEETDHLVVWCNQTMLELDADSGEEIAGNIFDIGIAEVIRRRETSYFVVLKDGGLADFTLGDNGLWNNNTEVTRNVSGAFYCRQDDVETLYQVSEKEGIIGCLTRKLDDQMIQVEVGEGITGFSFYDKMPFYTIIRNPREGEYIHTSFDLETHEKLFEIHTESSIKDCVWMPDQKTFCYLVHTDEGALLTACDSQSGETIWTKILKNYDAEDVTLLSCDGKEVLALCETYLFAEILNLETGEWEEDKILLTDHPAASVTNPGNISQSYMTRDGTYVIFVERYTQFTEGEPASLAVYNRKENCWVDLADDIENLNLLSSYTDIVVNAWNKNVIAVYEEGAGRVSVIDLDENRIIQKIPFSATRQRRMQFLGDDSGILLWGDDGYLKLWDIQREAITMEDNRKLYDVDSISVVVDEKDYFWVQGLDEEKTDFYTWNSWLMWLYRLDDRERYCPYVSWWNGTYVPETDRIMSISHTNDAVYWYDRYSLDDLLEMGRKLVGDARLSENDKVKYFIEE